MPNALVPAYVRSKTLQPSAFHGAAAGTLSRPKILLVEPEFDLRANKALLLTRAGYSVTTVRCQNDALRLQRDEGFSLAILNDTLGQPALRSVAQHVRRTWPFTRILILRHGKSALEDHLYDEAIDDLFLPRTFLDVLVKLADDPWNQRPKVFGANPGTVEGVDVPLPFAPSKPLESDPTKADPHDLDIEEESSWDTPAEERGRQTSIVYPRLGSSRALLIEPFAVGFVREDETSR